MVCLYEQNTLFGNENTRTFFVLGYIQHKASRNEDRRGTRSIANQSKTNGQRLRHQRPAEALRDILPACCVPILPFRACSPGLQEIQQTRGLNTSEFSVLARTRCMSRV